MEMPDIHGRKISVDGIHPWWGCKIVMINHSDSVHAVANRCRYNPDERLNIWTMAIGMIRAHLTDRLSSTCHGYVVVWTQMQA